MRFFKEPLVHFLLLGAALFGVHALAQRGAGAPPEPRRVVVSGARVATVLAEAGLRNGEPLAGPGARAAIDRWVTDEILYREAVALGLGEDDPVVRRRLVQKMEFLVEDAALASPPTPAELDAFYAAHAARFTEPERVSFTQEFLGEDGRAPRAFPLAPATSRRSRAQLAQAFGDEFAAAVMALPEHTPARVRSTYGWHLVEVGERVAPRQPALAEVASRVRAELAAARRTQARELAALALRSRYHVVLPDSAP